MFRTLWCAKQKLSQTHLRSAFGFVVLTLKKEKKKRRVKLAVSDMYADSENTVPFFTRA